MRHVANHACIRRLSARSFRANRTRNFIAVLAIALTSILFTSLFTITLSINHSFQQSNFRQAGGWSHATLKYLTETEYEELRGDPIIKQYGLRRFVGMPQKAPFQKSHVEIGYSDATQAHFIFCDPIEGSLPHEGTNEVATDTHVLELLGVEPVLGTEFTMTFDVDGQETTQTFVLSGWWDYDPAIVANHVLIPESRAEKIFETLDISSPAADGMTNTWNLDLLFSSSTHIAQNLEQLLQNHGYQSESRSEAHYISTGVNWGYTSTQLAENLDPITAVTLVGVLFLILFTGYLIIYNVFQISVTTDIRFYGLLKTIGTTGKQLRRIIRLQVLMLSLIGIPLGLILGYLIGAKLTPIIMRELNGFSANDLTFSPWIFILSALFSLFTVLLSCHKPARMAGKVSAIEAIRYIDHGTQSRKVERRTHGAKVPHMAWANLGRNRKKTALTITSLSLSIVLLQLTVTFTNGFDMDKYLARNVVSDFIFSNSSYFQSSASASPETALPEPILDTVLSQGGIAQGGKVYGLTTPVQEFITEDHFRKSTAYFLDPEQQTKELSALEKMPDGKVAQSAQLYGMEPFARSKLHVLEGDLSTLDLPGTHNIAAVYHEDDYGVPQMNRHWARLGDTITLRHVDSWEYTDAITGETLDPKELTQDDHFYLRAKTYRDISYTVTALVAVPYPISYRYYGKDEFVLGDQTFIADTKTENILLYVFNMKDKAAAERMESFLATFTKNQDDFDYESKATYEAEFESFRSMFLLLGGLLSLIVGLVGILNFFNVILTGILTRRREFAVLQAIGMTGKQLKQMLILEGILYTLGSLFISLLLSIASAPFVDKMLSSMFWFFTYHFTIAPILIISPVFLLLGIALPLISYHIMEKQNIVDRIREAD